MVTCVPFPQIQFSSWLNSELADPVGTRHLVSGSFAYNKLLGTGCDFSMAFDGLTLDAGASEPFVGSDVAVVNICIPNMGELQASGLTGAVYNMRFWLPAGSGTVLDEPGNHLQFTTSSQWTPNFVFPSGDGQQFLTALPSQFNVRRIDGRNELLSYNDENVSEFIYMRIFLDADFPIGTFGACGSGIFRPRLTYDFY